MFHLLKKLVSADLLNSNTNLDVTKLQQGLNNLEAACQQQRGTLTYPNQLEQAFQDDYNITYKTHRRIALLVGLFVLSTIGPLEFLVFNEYREMAMKVRYFSGVPFVIVTALWMLSVWFEKQQQTVVCLFGIYVSCAITAVLAVIPDSIYALYLAPYLILIFFISTAVRMLFSNALKIAIFTLIAINILFIWLRPQDVTITATYNAYYLCSAIIALAANYFLERAARLDFIHRQAMALWVQAMPPEAVVNDQDSAAAQNHAES